MMTDAVQQSGYPERPLPNSPMHTLIISLAFQHWKNPPKPYLLSDLTKIENEMGQKFNKLFLYDRKNAWYTNGIDGMGTIQESVKHIKGICQQTQITNLHIIGESMGAFGALLLASHLSKHTKVNSVLAMSPISFFSTTRANQYADYRYIRSMKDAKQHTPTVYNDVAYMPPPSRDIRIDLVYGGKAPVDHNQATTFDAMHAWRIKHYFSQTQIHTTQDLDLHPTSTMKRHNVFTKFLRAHIFNQPFPEWQLQPDVKGKIDGK